MRWSWVDLQMAPEDIVSEIILVMNEIAENERRERVRQEAERAKARIVRR